MQQDINAIEQLRLQLLDNGYTPIRNRDKRTFMKGWPHAVIDEGEIKRWTRRFSRDKGTGIRVDGELAVIDLDIDDEIINRIADAIMAEVPILGDPNVPLLVRRGKGLKEGWYVRTAEVFSRIHSRAWVRPGEDLDAAGAHRVEIFGGASPRQFGSFGPHTVGADGSVEISYRWADRSPADTRKSELPELTKAQFFQIADIVERELAAAGWTPVAKSTKGENDVQRVYDLTDEMQFDVDTGDRLSLQQLRELAAAYDGRGETLRCSAGWLEGPNAKRTDRCIVSLAQNGGVAIWESASSVTHCEASLKPRDFESEINRVAEKLKELDERRRNKVHSSDRAVTAATKMLATHAFCPNLKSGVVPIYATSVDDCIALQAFRTLMLPNCDEEIGPKGGRKLINPVDIWASSERRVTVRGLRMRPDKPRPIYEEDGAKWVNTYSPPVHDATGGYADIGLEFMEQLAPDPAERRWLLQWLAFKYRFPWVRGPAVVMVAHERFGTGRGLFGQLVRRLFGSRYVTEVPYSTVAGKTYQSQYTDWLSDNLIVLVNESSETEAGNSSYATKRNAYEHLKDMIEPGATSKLITRKGLQSTLESVFASFIIATNHMDALPIPATDRRMGVISNGYPREPEYWERLVAWMAIDANIAAFADALLAVDLTGYSPTVAPPMFEGKIDMAEASRSDLDRGLDLAIQAAGEVMTLDQVVFLMRKARDEYSLDYPNQWESLAKKAAVRQLHRVGVRDSTNWQIKIGSKKLAVYAQTKSLAKKWELADGLREAVLKGPSPSDDGTRGASSNIVSLSRSLENRTSPAASRNEDTTGDEPTD